MHLLPPDEDRTLVRALHAVDDLHEGRLPCAVLTHDGVNLTCLDAKVHVLVCNDPWEPLGDPLELDCGSFLRHQTPPGRPNPSYGWTRGLLPRARPSPTSSLASLRGSQHPAPPQGTVICPPVIFCAAASIWLLMSSMNPPEVDRPTPPVFKSNTAVPDLNCPLTKPLIVSKTATSTCFSMEVRTKSLYCGTVCYRSQPPP